VKRMSSEEFVKCLRQWVEEPFCFLLETVADPRKQECFSFAGRRPFLIFSSEGNRITLQRPGHPPESFEGDPVSTLRNLFKISTGGYPYRSAPDQQEWIPLSQGGAIGFFSYDGMRLFHPIPQYPKPPTGIPDILLAFYDEIIYTQEPLNLPECPSILQSSRIRGSWTKEEYLSAVNRIKEYISAGDIYQANLTQTFYVESFLSDPWWLYLRLRRTTPAPFSAFLRFDSLAVVSASPERFLRYDPRTRFVTTRPIKGTCRRGSTEEEDRRRAEDLLKSEKDRAENIMIVDVHRNDLGRVCEYGSVETLGLCELEAHPTVYHLVSTVRGRLCPEYDALDVWQSAFPAGSITGAPKIRAMQILEEIEPVRRGLYTGALGYLGFRGEMDLSVVIRTFVVQQQKVSFGVGGGIVADSDPLAEYEESLLKGMALAQALGQPIEREEAFSR
jgi:para-aminobenzoate synthetase component 1